MPALTENPLHTVETGEFAGWSTWPREAFETKAGPFYHRRDAGGAIRCAFRADASHINGLGVVHGGCLLTFVDYALFALATNETGGGEVVTVSLNSQFVGPSFENELIEARGEIVKAGRSLIFLRGLVRVAERPIVAFSGTIKRVKERRA